MALTAKQEAFARGVALEKLGQADAYRAAYDTSKMTPKSVDESASHLAADTKVAARIKVLAERATAAAVKTAGLTLDGSMAEAEALLQDAMALGQISAGVAAATLRAKLSGLLAEKDSKKGNPLDDLDVDGLLQLRVDLEAKIARNREALEMTGDLVPEAAAAPIRRVIG